ncbi:MAG: SpoVA/SpoVAEb family sporulation membrane protein [Clostridia bacterium]|nr:SpoVA/SpoVAEb family sporulation membrane protein [Clostridia bacterium]
MKKSTIIKDTALAFIFGGIICVIGQLITEGIMVFDIDKKTASTTTTIILIALGGLLTGFGIYSKLGKFAGAGTIVPITGFANSIVAPAIESKYEGLVLGLAAKLFTVAGPVIVYGVVSSIIVGIYYYIIYFLV